MEVATPDDACQLAGRYEVLQVARGAGLLTDGLLLRATIELRVADRRNANTVIVVDGRPRWFAKQASPGASGQLIDHEVALLEGAGADRRLPVPSLVAYDATRRLAITVFVDDSETLAVRFERLGRLNLDVARRLGRELARVHASDASRVRAPSVSPPWCYSLAAPLAEVVADASPGSLRLLARVQSTSLAEGLGRLATAWQPDAVVHNDLKFDNVLVARRRPHIITIADWETVTIGDPAWDVGSVVGEFLTAWLSSMSADTDATVGDIRASATRPLAEMLPAIHAFLDTYRRHADASPEFLYRSVANAGARVLQSAYESLQDRTALSPLSALQMQLAVNVVARPEEAAVRLLEVGTR